jgi:type II secretory pathway pseudopilin PulG
LLVVIAIIGILAGLIMYLLPGISEKKVRSRVHVELEAMITQIESYKLKKGFYPPDNPGRPDRPPLYYELTAKQLPQPPDPRAAIAQAMGLTNAVINSLGSEDAKNFYPTLRADQITELNAAEQAVGPEQGIKFLSVRAKNPNGNDFIIWTYDCSSTNRHNHESFDLWADVKVGNGTLTIGNWKE